MKILMLCDVLFPDTTGGAGRVTFNLSKELIKKGNVVYILTRNPENRFDIYQRLDDSLFVYRFSAAATGSFNLIYSEIRNSYSAAKKISGKSSFDIICIHQCLPAIGPSYTSLFNGCPILYLYHSPWHKEYLIKQQNNNGENSGSQKAIAFIMRSIERRFLNKSSKAIVLSKYMREKISKIHRYPENRISIIPAGVDLEHFHLTNASKESIKKKLGISKQKTLFLTVRNLVPRMGLENLIKAFSASRILKESCVLWIGGDGPLRHYLMDMVRSNDLQDNIKFLGFIPDEMLPEIYQAADFFILPTVELEGFGLVILEAMACGTPVIGTPVGAIPEILNRFDRRLIFKGTGFKEIKEELEQVVKMPDQFSFDPKRCRRFVEDNYSWEKMAQGFEYEAKKVCKNIAGRQG
ncbi:MAG: glycosyltransferase family 4 protein [Deltaproteobacteria bacterium]|nr:glycosyltransferase family 4 protein [Deltaproteobacteria bacterium]MBW2151172.1 glycosyltransferase family 4 protein [Deltaproteobacteria bacterium]